MEQHSGAYSNISTLKLNTFTSACRYIPTQFGGIKSRSEGLLVQAFEFLDLDYASVTAL